MGRRHFRPCWPVLAWPSSARGWLFDVWRPTQRRRSPLSWWRTERTWWTGEGRRSGTSPWRSPWRSLPPPRGRTTARPRHQHQQGAVGAATASSWASSVSERQRTKRNACWDCRLNVIIFFPSSATEHQGDLGTLPPRRLRGLSLLAGLQRGSGLSPLLHLVLQQDGGEALRPLPSPGERASNGEGVSAARRLLLLHGLVHGAGHQEVLQQHGGPADGQGWVSEGTWDFPTSAVLVVSFSFEYTLNSVGLFIRKGSKV